MADLELLAAFLDRTPFTRWPPGLTISSPKRSRRCRTRRPTPRRARQSRRCCSGRLGEAGYAAFALPEDGGPPDLRACCLVREALAAASPLADSIFALQCLGAQPILLGGSAELKRTFPARGDRRARRWRLLR